MKTSWKDRLLILLEGLLTVVIATIVAFVTLGGMLIFLLLAAG